MDSRIVEALAGKPRICNVCIMAHIDHGKTTFADGLLAINNWVPRQQVGRLRFLDSRPDEQQRGITMKASSILLYLSSEPPCLINIIDTPGHVDLVHETAVAASLSDACFILVDLMEGVVAQTRTALAHARRFRLRPVLVLNKFDRLFRERNVKQYFDFYLAIEEIVREANKLFLGYEDYVPEEERDKYFDLNRYNVVFGSATDNWMCSMGHFEEFLRKTGYTFLERAASCHPMWSLEEFYVSPKEKTISRQKIKGHPQMAVQLLFDMLGLFYQVETLSPDVILKIYRKIMRVADPDTPDEPLLKRFGVVPALPRLRKLLLETWMPLGMNCLQIISGRFGKDAIRFNHIPTETGPGSGNGDVHPLIQIAKIFLLDDTLVGLCKLMSASRLSPSDQLYIGDQKVEILDFCLMNGTNLVPIDPSIIQPGQIFAISFVRIGTKNLPQDTWATLKDTPVRVDATLSNVAHGDVKCAQQKNDLLSFSPVFKVIFLPRIRFLPPQCPVDDSIYQLVFKLLTLTDKMLKVTLKPNGFWELFFLGRLHYEKFLVDFKQIMTCVLKSHAKGMRLTADTIAGIDLSFVGHNLIQWDTESGSSPLLVTFQETISENFFIFHANGKKVTITLPNLQLVPVYVNSGIRKSLQNDPSVLDSSQNNIFIGQNRWILDQIPELVTGHLKLIFSYKGNFLLTYNESIEPGLINYLKTAFKMAIKVGGPLCEEPLSGVHFLVHLTSCKVADFDFQKSLAITEHLQSFIKANGSWFRLVVPLYQGDALLGPDSPSYQIVCEQVRRYDGKILHVEEVALRFQLPVTESEPFIDQIRKKCRGHVDVHFTFDDQEEHYWKCLDFVDEARRDLLIAGKESVKTRAGGDADDAEDVLDEDDADDLNDLLEMYENMEKSRVQPLVTQMRRNKGLFEELSYEAFTGEKQEKN